MRYQFFLCFLELLLECHLLRLAVLGLAAAVILLKADQVETAAAVDIEAEPYDVWLAVTEPDQRTRWMGGVTATARMRGQPGTKDSSMMLIVEVEAFTLTAYEDVLEADFPFLLKTMTTDNHGALSVETLYRLEPAETHDRTRLTVTETRNLEGTWAAWFAPFVETRSQNQLNQNLARLKALVEEAVSPPPR